ncbi:MAG: hypothetical protein IH936_12325 [Acidobacteria bacterium]|nr:hypothetical protein [Acidobacteriota bacterium]
MVRKIRELRPDVIITHHPPQGGHGHHQAIGDTLQKAFDVSADPKAFPEHLQEGLEPWQAARLYVRAFRGGEGVRIDLQVRGICCLRPGVAGLSDTITVTSIVGRFLEHSRIYYFHNGGEEELYIGSADLMPRNLDSRVEILVPVEDRRLRDLVRDDILFLHLADNVKARVLLSDGTYARVVPKAPDQRVHTQMLRLEQRGGWLAED